MSVKNTRLIDTQDAFNVLSDYYHHHTSAQHLALQEALNKVPTADAEPVRYGKWIFESIRGHAVMTCSECCKVQDGQTLCFTYCPNCGARMDEDD